MKKIILMFACLFATANIFSQVNTTETMEVLQKLTSINTFEKSAVKLYEATGVLEYSQGGTVQRIKLSDLGGVNVKANTSGFAVNLQCRGETGCVNFVKDEKNSSTFQTTAFFFHEAAVANTFAEGVSSLVDHYKTPEQIFAKELFKSAEGKTPILTLNKQKKAEALTQDNSDAAEVAAKKTPDAEEREAAKEEAKEKREEAREKREEEKKAKAEADAEKREQRKKARKEKAESSDEENAEANESPRRKRQAAGEDNTEGEDEAPSRKSKRNRLIEDVEDENKNGSTTDNEKVGSDFCGQLKTILQSGQATKFKDIEGEVTNAGSKINASKIKLKGARKSYLSWFKKERAFIAELKNTTNYEQIARDFDEIQTQLDECLGAGWDHEDKSNSEEYAQIKTEVKDVQYSKDVDDGTPAIRVILLEDNNRFSLFLRIR